MGPTGDVGRGEGRLQLVFCYSAREETEELGLGNRECHHVLLKVLKKLLGVSYVHVNYLLLGVSYVHVNTVCYIVIPGDVQELQV